MNRYLQEKDMPKKITKKRPKKKNYPQQLQTYNVPIEDVENTNGTN